MVNEDSTKVTTDFQSLGKRKVEVDFSAGHTTSDGGVLALREFADRCKILTAFAACFVDHRNKHMIEHSLEELLYQRVLGIVCGYEDLNDHDTLRSDVALAVAVGKKDPTGQNRRRECDRGTPLAGKSTLNRLELTPEDADSKARYKKIVCNFEAVDRFFVDVFLNAHTQPPKSIVLDIDTTDDLIHGEQEGRHYHGYYGGYCYLPLYVFCEDHLLCAKLRTADAEHAEGTRDELQRIVEQIRQRWPSVKILIRGDSGFSRETLMAWCEANQVDYIFGLAKNSRLKVEIEREMDRAKEMYQRTEEPARVFKGFKYRTLDTWSRARRVIAKAEYTNEKENPRFIVTSIKKYRPSRLYEKVYCARGDMENRIKEQQLDLFADRTSTALMRSNQARLYLASVAYILLSAFRRVALKDTALEKAQCGTIRNRLIKIGGVIRVTVRRVHIALSSAFPLQDIYVQVMANIAAAYPIAV